MLKMQMLTEKTNYEPHLNIELLTGSFIENKFKKICTQSVYDAYFNETEICNYLVYRLNTECEAFIEGFPLVLDYIEYINMCRIVTCENIPVITYVYNTLLREPGDRELIPDDDASLILNNIQCFFDIDEDKLVKDLLEVINEKFLINHST
jgi:hypothetical protein